jgi:hypothetical protein
LQGVDNIGNSSGKGGQEQDTEGFHKERRINRRFKCKYIKEIVLFEHLKSDTIPKREVAEKRNN